MSATYWYRFEDQRYAAPVNEYDETVGVGRLVVHLRKFKVLRETPKGVQLVGCQYGTSHPRFVLRSAYRRFACPTIDEAKESFRARKQKQAAIYYNRAGTAEEAVRLMDLGKIDEGRDW